MQDHAVVKVFNTATSCGDEEEWEQSMKKTGHAGDNHFGAKTKGHTHVLKVVFPNTGRMFCKSTFQHSGGVSP